MSSSEPPKVELVERAGDLGGVTFRDGEAPMPSCAMTALGGIDELGGDVLEDLEVQIKY